MKISFRLIIVLLLSTAGEYIMAQDMKAEQRFGASDKAYTLLQEYIATMDFKENALSKGYDEAQIAKFKSLFTADAKVLDEINYFPDMCHLDSPAVFLPIDAYLNKLRQNFPAGISSRVVKSYFKFDDLDNKKISVYLEKSLRGQYQSLYNYEVRDTVILALIFSDDLSDCKITSISKAGRTFKCPNCTPCGAKPKPPVASDGGVASPKTPATKPEGDLSINIGAPLTTPIVSKPDVTKLNYTGLIPGSSSINGFKVAPIGISIAGSLEFDLYFSKNVGLSTGLYYDYSTMKATYSSLNLSYEVINTALNLNPGSIAGTPFLRRYTASNGTENISMQNLGIPLILKTKFPINAKTDFFFHIGGMVTFLNNQASKYDATVDQEAIYQYRQGVNGNYSYTYTATGPQQAPTDLVLTKAAIAQEAAHSNTSTAAATQAFFQENQNLYDIALNQSVSNKQTFNYKLGYGGLLRFGVTCKLSKVVGLNIGADFSGLYVSGNKQSGNALTDQLGGYNSVFYAVNQTINISYFLNFGFQFKL